MGSLKEKHVDQQKIKAIIEIENTKLKKLFDIKVNIVSFRTGANDIAIAANFYDDNGITFYVLKNIMDSVINVLGKNPNYTITKNLNLKNTLKDISILSLKYIKTLEKDLEYGSDILKIKTSLENYQFAISTKGENFSEDILQVCSLFFTEISRLNSYLYRVDRNQKNREILNTAANQFKLVLPLPSEFLEHYHKQTLSLEQKYQEIINYTFQQNIPENTITKSFQAIKLK
jgi:hypothetical protein